MTSNINMISIVFSNILAYKLVNLLKKKMVHYLRAVLNKNVHDLIILKMVLFIVIKILCTKIIQK